MTAKVWKTRVLLICVQLVALIALIAIGQSQLRNHTITSNLPPQPINQEIVDWQAKTQNPIFQPEAQPSPSPVEIDPAVQQVKFVPDYTPKYQISWANPLNYGPRYAKDINGVPVYNQPIIVLHETVNSASSALNTFKTPHANEKNQVSYHALITLDGTIVYIVPREYRAFGAGNSVFNGPNGPETVKTHPNFPPSVNNFAYHIAFETPPNGRNSRRTHSGYTEAQYKSLAWLIAQSSVPENRITTHKAVDRSRSRIDPRSFDGRKFLSLLASYRQVTAGNSNAL